MTTLNNFFMFAKDRDVLDALISIKVQDNSDGDISRSVREDLINMRTFAMEYDVGIRKEKLPECFAREFGMEVAPFVMLRDPCQNEFEVVVEKKNDKVYFSHGWASLKNFYDILGGSWDYSICMIKNRNPWSVGSKIELFWWLLGLFYLSDKIEILQWLLGCTNYLRKCILLMDAQEFDDVLLISYC